MNPIAAIIPVKNFKSSKLRLSQVLTNKERENFSILMLNDVLKVIEKINFIKIIIITTPKENQIKNDTVSKLKVLYDDSKNINDALYNAIEYCKKLNFNQILILPSDIPLINEKDIEKLLDIKNNYNYQIIIIPSNRKDGTNMLLFDANLNINTFFGKNSFQKHQIEFNSKFKTYIHHSFNIGLDIDYEQDLKTFFKYSKNKKCSIYKYLKKINISKKL